MSKGPHEVKSANESSSGEPAMPSIPWPSHMHTLAPFQNMSFCQSLEVFLILYSSLQNVYPTVFAYVTVTGSHVHKTWCRPSPECRKKRKSWFPTLCLCLVFVNFPHPKTTTKQIHVHSHNTRSIVCPVILVYPPERHMDHLA